MSSLLTAFKFGWIAAAAVIIWTQVDIDPGVAAADPAPVAAQQRA